MTDEQAEATYRKFHDLEPFAELPEDWRQFEAYCIPETVQCDECGSWFCAKDEEPA